MCKKVFFLMIALAGICVGANAQATKEACLKLSYYQMTDTISATMEEFSLTGAEVLIEDNVVSIVYDGKPENNREFDFDRIQSFDFGLRAATGFNKVRTLVLRVYVDKANMLHVEAEKPLGNVDVYAASGALAASLKTNETQAQINLSAVPHGVYVVRSGANSLLIIK